MKSTSDHILFSAGILVLSASVALSQTTLQVFGHVLDSASSQPIANVNVIVRGHPGGTTTDTLGAYWINLVVGVHHTLVFSHVSYAKLIQPIFSDEAKVQLDVNLVPQTIALEEVVVSAKKPFSVSTEAVKRASFAISGNEFERLGESDPEKAFTYLLPNVVQPLQERLRPFGNDFTLYVDGQWVESAYLSDINPFAITRVLVWEKLGSRQSSLSHDIFPIGLPLRRGRYVVLIETTSATKRGQ